MAMWPSVVNKWHEKQVGMTHSLINRVGAEFLICRVANLTRFVKMIKTNPTYATTCPYHHHLTKSIYTAIVPQRCQVHEPGGQGPDLTRWCAWFLWAHGTQADKPVHRWWWYWLRKQSAPLSWFVFYVLVGITYFLSSLTWRVWQSHVIELGKMASRSESLSAFTKVT